MTSHLEFAVTTALEKRPLLHAAMATWTVSPSIIDAAVNVRFDTRDGFHGDVLDIDTRSGAGMHRLDYFLDMFERDYCAWLDTPVPESRVVTRESLRAKAESHCHDALIGLDKDEVTGECIGFETAYALFRVGLRAVSRRFDDGAPYTNHDLLTLAASAMLLTRELMLLSEAQQTDRPQRPTGSEVQS